MLLEGFSNFPKFENGVRGYFVFGNGSGGRPKVWFCYVFGFVLRNGVLSLFEFI